MNFSVIKNLSPLAITLSLSAVFHLALIGLLNFEPPELRFIKDKMPALDIVLVNAKTKSKPSKADALAQANLNRGGNTEENRQMKSALPPPKNKPTEVTVKPEVEANSMSQKAARAQAEVERKQQRVSELEKQTLEVMTQLQAKSKLETKPKQQVSASHPENGQEEATAKTLNAADLMESSLEIARLEAQIAKQQDDYQKRPKRKFVGARVQEYIPALYLEAWRQKVEKIGTLNYPEAAKNQGIYGKVRMTVSIKSDGHIEKIVINQGSGNKILDEAARHIVEMGEPYSPFSDELRKETDVIDFTRTLTFTKQDNMATE